MDHRSCCWTSYTNLHVAQFAQAQRWRRSPNHEPHCLSAALQVIAANKLESDWIPNKIAGTNLALLKTAASPVISIFRRVILEHWKYLILAATRFRGNRVNQCC